MDEHELELEPAEVIAWHVNAARKAGADAEGRIAWHVERARSAALGLPVSSTESPDDGDSRNNAGDPARGGAVE